MAVPTQKQFHRPILEIVRDRKSIVPRVQISQALVGRFALTETDLQDMVPSGMQTRFDNRVYWALSYLKRAGLLYAESPGRFTITASGTDLLSETTGDIEKSYLQLLINKLKQQADSESEDTEQPPTADEHSAISDGSSVDLDDATPDEQIALTYVELVEKLTDDLLDRIKGMKPNQFEQLVLDLLVQIGYGRGEVVGKSGDGGIDVIFNLDPLGLDKVYAQAKKWADNVVGSPDIQKFSGSLDPFGATKGVFITTSRFSSAAQEYTLTISASGKLIRLINGQELAELMIRNGVGVVTERTYEIKKLDENYFAE